MVDKVRKFTHRLGFYGGPDNKPSTKRYIQCNPDGSSWYVDENGAVLEGFGKAYPLSKCLRFVDERDWIEITNDNIERETE